MTSLIEADLGPDGVAYLVHCLKQGLGLSAKLLELPLASGRVFSPLPKQIPPDRARAFDAGGLMVQYDYHLWLTDHLRAMWKVAREGTFVVQDLWVRPSDPAVQREPAKKFFEDSGVYYFLERGDLSAATIKATIRATASFTFIGIFSAHVIRDRQLAPDRKVSADTIERLGKSAREIFVSAYDREGLVVWQSCEPASG